MVVLFFEISGLLLPKSLPNSLGITQLPVFRLAPFRTLTPAEAFHLVLGSQILQYASDHVHADVRTFLPKLGYAKRTLHPVNGTKYETRLFPLGTLDPPETIFKFFVSRLDDKKDVIDVRPRVVFSFVPTGGAFLQSFIVTFLFMIDQTFQTDVSPDLKPKMVAL